MKLQVLIASVMALSLAGCGGGGSSDDLISSAAASSPSAANPAAVAAASGVTIAGASWKQCAIENGTCTFSGKQEVLFGTKTQYIIKTFTSKVGCDNTSFGTDPAYGFDKACYVKTTPVVTPPVVTPPVVTPPVVTPPVVTPPVVTPPVVTPPSGSTPALSCTKETATTAATGSGKITVDTPSADGTRMFPQSTPFGVVITTRPGSAADTLNYVISDTFGKTVSNGSFAVPKTPTTTSLSCTSTLAGYFSVAATFTTLHGAITTAGSAPAGMVTFGVLPSLTSVLPIPTYVNQDQHRFGMQGFNGDINHLTKLGTVSTIDDRQMATTEPSAKNTFQPGLSNLDPFYSSNPSIMRLVRLDGLPAFESPNGTAGDEVHAPTNTAYYQNYMSRVGTDTELVRSTYYPKQSANFYQVLWEPGVFNVTDADVLTMYKYAYAGLHATDSKAVVMGPTEAFPSLTISRLQSLAPKGYANYIDAVTTHGYYDAGTMPSHPPERLATDPDPATALNALPNNIRALRAEMQKDYKPNMKLFVTETGISYDLGTAYGDGSYGPNVLYAQAAVTVRTHIILLGEGADQTYVFFGNDYPNEVGYGTFFDVDNPQGAFGGGNLSPKPSAMAVTAMTNVLDGTTTLGAVKNAPAEVYAYSFQKLGGGKIVTAAWTHHNAVWDKSVGFSSTYTKSFTLTVDSAGTSGNVDVIDMMGNRTSTPYTNGQIVLALTESPQYVVSTNTAVAKTNATVPVGYIAKN